MEMTKFTGVVMYDVQFAEGEEYRLIVNTVDDVEVYELYKAKMDYVELGDAENGPMGLAIVIVGYELIAAGLGLGAPTDCDESMKQLIKLLIMESKQERREDGADILYCPVCDSNHEVSRIIPPRYDSADPTEFYELECGHIVLGLERPEQRLTRQQLANIG